MLARIVLGALIFLASDARAESIQCGSVDAKGRPEYIYRVEASKTARPKVWIVYGSKELMNNPAEVLYHFYPEVPADFKGLGMSMILARQRDERGNLLMPELIVVNWMKGELAVSYQPIFNLKELLIVRDNFDCARLD